MAIFNPDVPNRRDPNYLGYSRPIPQPESNQSAKFAGQAQEYLGEADKYKGVSKGYDYAATAAEVTGQGQMFKDAGELLGQGVKAADTYVKDVIKDEVYDKASALRDYYKTQLAQSPLAGLRDVNGTAVAPQQGMTTGAVGGRVAAEGAQDANTPMSLLPQANKVPDGVSNAVDNADLLTQARQNGKLSETDYIGRMNQIASDVRGKYPGYKDYVDSQFERITGMNPANALVKSLVGDINAALQDGKNIKNHVMNQLSSPAFVGYPQADAIWRGVASGNLPIDDAVKWMSLVKRDQTQWEYIANKNTASKATEDMQEREAKNMFNDSAPTVINNMFMGFLANSQHPALGSAKDIGDFATKAMNGEIQVSTTQAQQLGEALTSMRSQARSYLYQQAVSAGYVKTMGAGAVGKMIDESLIQYDTVAQLVSQNKWDLASSVANFNDALVKDATKTFLSSKDTAPYMLGLGAARKIAGDQYVGQFAKELYAGTNMTTELKGFVQSEAFKLLGQSGDIRKTGYKNAQQPYTISDASAEAQKRDIQDPKVFSAINALPTRIADPKLADDAKINLAQAAFDPKNIDYIGKIARTGKDSQGRVVAGQDELFNSWTNPKITQEMKRLDDQRPDLNLWNNYKSWAETSFGRVLFNQKINDLNGVQDLLSYRLSYTNIGGIPQFTVLPSDTPEGRMARQYGGGNAAGYVQAQDTIRQMNQGLSKIAIIAKTEGKDVDAYVAQLLMGAGWDPKAGKQPATVPEWMGRALDLSRPAKPQKGSQNDSGDTGATRVATNTQNAPAASTKRVRGNLTDEVQSGPAQIIDVGPTEDINQYLTRKPLYQSRTR